MYYRFKDGSFIKAETFKEAKEIKLALIKTEPEDLKRWYKCTCLGFSHRSDCPEATPVL